MHVVLRMRSTLHCSAREQGAVDVARRDRVRARLGHRHGRERDACAGAGGAQEDPRVARRARLGRGGRRHAHPLRR